MKGKQAIYIGIPLLLAVVVGFFYAWKKGVFSTISSDGEQSGLINSDIANTGGYGPTTGTGTVRVSYCDPSANRDYHRTLSIGYSGPEVCDLQTWLNQYRSAHSSMIAIDGVFGPQTEQALISITQSNKIALVDLVTLQR